MERPQLAQIRSFLCRPIAALAADDGPLQMSLFDQVNLAEITHPHYPAERLIACRNPALAIERARKRLALLTSTDTELAKITAAVVAGRLAGAGKIGIRVGKGIGRYKMAKHYTLTIVRHEALLNRAVVKGHRLRLVAASRKKLRAA